MELVLKQPRFQTSYRFIFQENSFQFFPPLVEVFLPAVLQYYYNRCHFGEFEFIVAFTMVACKNMAGLVLRVETEKYPLLSPALKNGKLLPFQQISWCLYFICVCVSGTVK